MSPLFYRKSDCLGLILTSGALLPGFKNIPWVFLMPSLLVGTMRDWKTELFLFILTVGISTLERRSPSSKLPLSKTSLFWWLRLYWYKSIYRSSCSPLKRLLCTLWSMRQSRCLLKGVKCPGRGIPWLSIMSRYRSMLMPWSHVLPASIS